MKIILPISVYLINFVGCILVYSYATSFHKDIIFYIILFLANAQGIYYGYKLSKIKNEDEKN